MSSHRGTTQHRPAPLGPFQLSASLPPRSSPIEPYSRDQERIQEIQREPDVANEDLTNKGMDFNELRELIDGLRDQVA